MSSLIIEANLLVGPEFAEFLGNAGLTGADVGDARGSAVPVPSAAAMLGLAGLAGLRRRRN